jgi:2-polyprenyl-3-methyl-5-hydroxy-6-metoxy-1,4-benzoquinol methylase
LANFINRAKYYAASVAKWPSGRYFNCPNCGSKPAETVDRKYLVTSLARCPDCEILFRQPTDTKEELATFYSDDYTTGVTDTPKDWSPASWGPEALRNYRDFSEYLRVLKAAGCGPGAKLFDYGCSWGYGAGQYKAAGMDVSGYEISPVNRRFAREVIGINMVDDFEAYARELAAPEYDVFISSHVLEHLPEVTPVLQLAERLVKPGGLMIFFVPNGSESFMRANRARWRRLWGEVHPLFLTDKFFRKAIRHPMLLAASPVSADAIARFVAEPAHMVEALEGKELTCIVSLR